MRKASKIWYEQPSSIGHNMAAARITLPQLFDTLSTQLESGELALFVGSGVSKDPPAFLPIWKEIGDDIIRTLSGRAGIRLKKSEIASISSLRPEIVLQILYDIFGRNALDCLAVLRGGIPNASHFFSAYCLALGNTVCTTNFDNLIEEACQISKTAFRLFANESDMPSYNPRGSLLKLHGTLVDENGVDALETILTTIRQVSRGLSVSHFNALESGFANRTALFIGYSGLDEFDIMPALNKIDIKRCVWINHVHAKMPGTPLSQSAPDPLDKLLKFYFEDTIRIDAHTHLFVNQLYSILDNKHRMSTAAPRSFLTTTSKYDSLRTQGRLAEAGGDASGASRFYLKAKSLAESSEQQKLSQDDLAYIRGLQGQTQKALEAYRALEKLATNDVEKAGALYGQGKAYRVLGNIPLAIDTLESAWTLFESTDQKSTAFNLSYDLGMAYLINGNLDRAEGLFQEGVRVFGELGDINRNVWMATGTATILLLQGKFSSAKATLTSVHQAYQSGIESFPRAILTLSLAEIERCLENHSDAQSLYSDASSQFSTLMDIGGMASADLGLADIFRMQGDLQMALALIDKHLPILTQGDRHVLAAQFLLERVEIKRAMGLATIGDYDDLQVLFNKIGMPSGVIWAMLGKYSLTYDHNTKAALGRKLEAIFDQCPRLTYQKSIWQKISKTETMDVLPITFI